MAVRGVPFAVMNPTFGVWSQMRRTKQMEIAGFLSGMKRS